MSSVSNTSHHRIGDAVNLLDIRGNRYVRINERLEDRQLVAVRSKAHSSYFDEAVHDREEAGGLSVEGDIGDIGETCVGVVHEPSRPLPGEPLCHHRL
jgi:hypothetical protein